MTSRLQYTRWFAVPFLVELVAIIGLRLWDVGDNPAPPLHDQRLSRVAHCL